MAVNGTVSRLSNDDRLSSEPLLLLHPIGLDRDFWSLRQPGWAGGVDLPGHGSRRGEDFPDRLEAVADELAAGLDPSHVIGVSLGGMIAQHLAIRHPALVRSLVLVNTVARTDREQMLARAKASGGLSGRELVQSTIDRWFGCSVVDDDIRDYVCSSLTETRREVWSQCWRAMAEHDVADQLADAPVAITLIAGASDRAVNAESMSEWSHQLRDARVETLTGGHLVSLESPGEFQTAIRRHLRRLSASPRPHSGG